MPSKSKKQAKLMTIVANNPKFAKKVGVPQTVGKEFHQADLMIKGTGGRTLRGGILKGAK